jgi:uncharacterized protein YuzE
MTPVLTVDTDARAAYLLVSEGDVVRTVEVTDAVLLDLDSYDMVVGVEVLELDAEIPSNLEHDYHVPSGSIEFLNRIKPNVTTFMASASTSPVPAGAPRNTLEQVCC